MFVFDDCGVVSLFVLCLFLFGVMSWVGIVVFRVDLLVRWLF